jgi:hypothetical protein
VKTDSSVIQESHMNMIDMLNSREVSSENVILNERMIPTAGNQFQ